MQHLMSKAVTSTLDAARWPLERTRRMLPGAEDGFGLQVTGLLDRADGAVRAAAGRALRDPELEAEGRRRQVAAAERIEAARLRAIADEKRVEAEQQKAERLAAQERAAEVRKEKARQTEAQRKAATSKAAKQARLRVIEDEAAALDAEEGALATADEAERLATAAAKTKAARKG
jgi:uncharacterized protein YjbJ (UPF0337 family)